MENNRAVFVDRDGVINELLYFPEHGRIDTPLKPSQFKLLPGVAEAIMKFQKMGYKVIVVSNQPGVAKKNYNIKIFDQIRKKMHSNLAKFGVKLDDELYCMHHPYSKLQKYRKKCFCRKPKPGLILMAAKKYNIDLNCSFMIGDGLTDTEAGQAAGCRTILVAHMSSLLSKMMQQKNLYPDFVVSSLLEASKIVEKETL